MKPGRRDWLEGAFVASVQEAILINLSNETCPPFSRIAEAPPPGWN